MKLKLKLEWLAELKKNGGSAIDDYGYRKPEDYASFDTDRFTDGDLKKLDAIVAALDKTVPGVRGLRTKIKQYWQIKADPAGTIVSKLDTLALALQDYIAASAHKWLFEDHADGQQVAWHVCKIEYAPPTDRGNPAVTSMYLAAMTGRERSDRTVNWFTGDLGKSTAALLSERGYTLETPEAVDTHRKECRRYQEICDKTGEQFLASGQARVRRSYYDDGMVSMEVDGLATRVVMDDAEDVDDDERTALSGRRKENLSSAVVSVDFWTPGQKGRFKEEDDETAVAVLPLQPYVTMYNLSKYCFLFTHVNNVTEYTYDVGIIDKLVLEKEKKDLVSILVAGADTQLDDIVKGKTGGIIVICTGRPGLGKTLTAEAFSEEMKRPLYCVQCSQLGTSEEVLEKKLNVVLSRATRWRAILLIDEADVYIHERGNDIQQNAIVGVFLRVLEYYRGVLFMTSNRETIVDDAIMSRATAWIQYTYPDKERLRHIWSVLAAQYGVPVGPDLLRSLVAHPTLGSNISGRTVKSLLKLARLLSLRSEQKIDLRLFEYVSQFLDLDGKNRKSKVVRDDCS